MRVMYIASNPDNARSLQIEREVNGLQERLVRGVGADPIAFCFYTDLPIVKLVETIRRFQPDVLHFAAHGDNDALVVAHPTLGEVELDGPTLSTMLMSLPVKPKLIVFNACSSNGIAASVAASGVAEYVIGTDAPITNVAARCMATELYQRLADAASIAEAFSDAAANLRVMSGGKVSATLHPIGRVDGARFTRLVDPLRIVACMPEVDRWLDKGLDMPKRAFDPKWPEILFGVAGTPAAARQTVFFTDDETVEAGDEGLESARSWIIESQPVNGEIWMTSSYKYYGDMQWYAAVTTTDRRIVSTASQTTDGLKRYYHDEKWKGEIPPAIGDLIDEVLANLIINNGGRRGRVRVGPPQAAA